MYKKSDPQQGLTGARRLIRSGGGFHNDTIVLN